MATPPDVPTQIGLALKQARQRRDLTQEQAAKLVGVHTTVWARYEQGKREAPVSFIRKVERKLGVKVDTDVAVPLHEPPSTIEPGGASPIRLLDIARRLQRIVSDVMDEANRSVTP